MQLLSAPSFKWRMSQPLSWGENVSQRGASHVLQVAGFFAIFNEANYPSGTSLNDSFFGSSRHVIPQVPAMRPHAFKLPARYHLTAHK